MPEDLCACDQSGAPDLDVWRAEAGAALEVADAATEPPWEAAEEIVLYVAPGADPTPPWNIPAIVDDNGGMQEDDARFIAAARTGWPRDAARVGVLCERVAALEARIATLDALKAIGDRQEALADRFAARCEVLEAGLREALDEFEDAIQYKLEYLVAKHGDRETLARLRAIAAGTAAAAGEEPTR